LRQALGKIIQNIKVPFHLSVLAVDISINTINCLMLEQDAIIRNKKYVTYNLF